MLWSLVLYNSNNKFRPSKTLVTMQLLFKLIVLFTTSKRGNMLHHVTVLISLFMQNHSRVQPIYKVLVFLLGGPWKGPVRSWYTNIRQFL